MQVECVLRFGENIHNTLRKEGEYGQVSSLWDERLDCQSLQFLGDLKSGVEELKIAFLGNCMGNCNFASLDFYIRLSMYWVLALLKPKEVL